MSWEWSTNRPDNYLGKLMKLADEALREEDRELRNVLLDALKKQQHPALANVGKGLSYWLYETTLVYLIWRAWIREGHIAAWDWTVADLKRVEARGKRKYSEPGGKRFDLLLFDRDELESPRVSHAFEAKWWNGSGVEKAIQKDIKRLLRSGKLADARKYLLLFWHESDEKRAAYAEKVRRFCVDNRVSLLGTSRFEAQWWDKKDVQGHFVMALVECKSGSAGRGRGSS